VNVHKANDDGFSATPTWKLANVEVMYFQQMSDRYPTCITC